MAEETADLRPLPKPEAYALLARQLDSVLAGCDDEVTAMATLSGLVHRTRPTKAVPNQHESA